MPAEPKQKTSRQQGREVAFRGTTLFSLLPERRQAHL